MQLLTFILVSFGLAINFANGENFSNTKHYETEIKEYRQALNTNIKSLREDLNRLLLTDEEIQEIDSQFYTLIKKIETMRAKDEYEWASNKESIDISYNDLIKNIDAIKSIKVDRGD